jgi:hypothetical protein
VNAGNDAPEPPVAGGSSMPSNRGELGFRHLGLGVFLLAATAGLAYSIATDPAVHQNFGSDPGPAFLPDLLLWLLGLGAVALTGSGVIQLGRAGWHIPRPIVDLKSSTVPMLMVISIVLYNLLVPVMGFLAVSILFAAIWSFGLAYQDDEHSLRPLAIAVAGSAGTAVCIYLLFKQLIGIPLG